MSAFPSQYMKIVHLTEEMQVDNGEDGTTNMHEDK
jgi:hypothetical protein